MPHPRKNLLKSIPFILQTKKSKHFGIKANEDVEDLYKRELQSIKE